MLPREGIATITSVPDSPMEGNTLEMRKLWVGCEIKGNLINKIEFEAKPRDCFEALIRKHGFRARKYIKYLKQWLAEDEKNHPWLVPTECHGAIRLPTFHTLNFFNMMGESWRTFKFRRIWK